jgi:S1-C subfamily serine protease
VRSRFESAPRDNAVFVRLAAVLAGAVALAGCAGNDDRGAVATEPQPRQPRQASGDGSFGEIPEVVDRVQPSVVSVLVGGGQGSGVVYDQEGLIVTNAHVVGDAREAEIVLLSGARLQARVRAIDPLTDLALLEVERDGLPAAEFAEALPDTGELAIAMGNPLGFENTVTAGIVSGVNRSIPSGGQTPALVDLIQTDAPISPGNSGGALVGGDGKVIGINVAFIPPEERAVSLGFAIPAPTVTSVVEQLVETGRARHAYLAIRPAQVTPQLDEAFGLGAERGVLVREVIDGGPADEAGMRAGDVIVRFDGDEIETVEDLFAKLREVEPGDEVELAVVRDGDERELTVELGERSD